MSSLLKEFFSGQVDESLKWETVTNYYVYDVAGPDGISGGNLRNSCVQHLVDNKFVHLYREVGGATMFSQIITVNSPSSVSLGTPTDSGECYNSQPWFLLTGQSIAVIDSTKIALIYKDSGNKLSLRIQTISGDTITDNGESVIGASSNCSSASIIWNGSWLLVGYLDDWNDDYTLETYSVSGTSTTYSGYRVDASGGFRFNGTFAPVPGTTNEFILGMGRSDADGGGELIHVTVNNSTGNISLVSKVEMGTAVRLSNANLLMFSSTTGLAFYRDQVDNDATGRRFTLSGTTISVSSSRIDLPDGSESGKISNRNSFFYDIDNKKFVLGSAYYYFAYQYDWDTESYTKKNSINYSWGSGRDISDYPNVAFGGGYMVISACSGSGSNWYNSIIVI